MSPTVGDKIIKFTGEVDSEEQIAVHAVLQQITDQAVKIKKHSLKTFFDNNFRIPEYQRGYEWEEENWEELWDEIDNIFEINEGRVSSNLTDVFFGSMFFAERDGEEVNEDDIEVIYDIIDGQQRITTLTILFKILADRLYENVHQDPNLRRLSGEPTAIEELIYQDVGAGMERRPSLLPNRHQRDLFDSIMKHDEEDQTLIEYVLARDRLHGNTKRHAIKVEEFLDSFGIDHSAYLTALEDDAYYSEEIDGRPNLTGPQLERVQAEDDMASLDPGSGLGHELLTNKVEIHDDTQTLIDAYVYFETEIENRLDQLETPKERSYAIINVKNYILHSFLVGYFEVQSDQPKLLMRIFEILNDRGMELKKADVMRTRIVACFRNDSQQDDYVDTWEGIVERFGNERIIDFLRTYFVVSGDARSRGELKDHLLEAFDRTQREENDYKLQSRLKDVEDAKKFLDKLSIYAAYYDDITDVENRGVDLGEGGDEELEDTINRILIRLRKADTSIWEPLVLGVYHDIAEEEIEKQHKLVELLRAIESMAIRKFAVMDTQTRDQAYVKTIEEYHEEKLDGNLITVLTDIETDDPNAVGERLVEELYRSDWRKQWGKQALRKIASENFSRGEGEIVLKELNVDDTIVHLEHIFPQTPIRSNAPDEYAWFKIFFKTTAASPTGTDSSENMRIEEMISQFISSENEDALKEIAAEYENDIGNLTLLHSEGNISIQNELFDVKAREYLNTESYCDLETSGYICSELLSTHSDNINRYLKITAAIEKLTNDADEETWIDIADDIEVETDSETVLLEKLKTEQTELATELEVLRDEWTYERITENRAYLIEKLCELIAFNDSEFAEVDFEKMSREDTSTKNDIITANYRRRLN